MSCIRQKRRRGIAIALVMFFVIVLLLFLGAMTFTRSGRKRQTKQSLQYLKAHFLAQGALQHALLKIRMLPNEVFDASCLQRGLCPFYRFESEASITAGDTKQQWAMDTFRQDINTTASDGVPLRGDSNYDDWGYEVPQMEAITSVVRQDAMVHIIEITVSAKVPAQRWEGPSAKDRVEAIRKTVEVVRGRET